MQLFINEKDCCGCEACVNKCRNNAIEMEADKFGFLYPKIKKNNCIECGQCLTVCPQKNVIFSGEINKCYVGVSKNESQMLKSSSGGIFPLLAEKFINDGGIVFGAAYYYDEKNNRSTCACMHNGPWHGSMWRLR